MADLNALVLFARVIEANSFSEAGRRLRMPVSTVSRRIAELEAALGIRLLDRSTRSLRLTAVGAEVLEHAKRTAEINEAVHDTVSNRLAAVSGLLRLSSPPSLSDSLLAPLVGAFQGAYPDVRVQVRITDRMVDHVADGIDVAFRVGPLKDSGLIARRILTYRHLLVAAPDYLRRREPPTRPQDLLSHPLLAFSHGRNEARWTLTDRTGAQETLRFVPHFSINDFAGLTTALINDGGIGDLPPVVSPELMRDGRLVEVMPDWHLPVYDLSLVHAGGRHVSRPVRVFKDFAASMVPTLFPDLPR